MGGGGGRARRRSYNEGYSAGRAASAYSSYRPPAYSAPRSYTPTYSAPAPTYRAPTPTYSAPRPAPTPTYRAPTPTYRAPTPTYRAPTPTYSAPRAPTPVSRVSRPPSSGGAAVTYTSVDDAWERLNNDTFGAFNETSFPITNNSLPFTAEAAEEERAVEEPVVIAGAEVPLNTNTFAKGMNVTDAPPCVDLAEFIDEAGRSCEAYTENPVMCGEIGGDMMSLEACCACKGWQTVEEEEEDGPAI